MGNRRARMFNKRASSLKSKPDQVMDSLAVRPGQNVVDIGSGGGYFTLLFASIVGKEGQVYAVDTDPKLLEFIRNSAKERELANIKTIQITDSKLVLPEKSLDLVFMRNVYHHLPDRVEYCRNLQKALKSEGKIAIIDYKPGRFLSFHRLLGHHIHREAVIAEMEKAGYQLKEEYDFLSEQSFTVFSIN